MGDRSIQGRLGEGMGSLHLETFDASSKQTGSYSEERVVDGKAVFLSAPDAEHLDAALASGDRSWTVHTAGGAWERIKAALDEFRSAP